MSNIDLHDASAGDLDRCLGMMQDFYFLENYSFDRVTAMNNFREFISSDHLGKFWLIGSEHEIIGYLILTFGYSFEYGGRDAFIDELFLKEAYRGKGLGMEVLDQLHSKAKVLGVNAVHLEVENRNAVGNSLYVKSGFRRNDRSLLTKRIDP